MFFGLNCADQLLSWTQTPLLEAHGPVLVLQLVFGALAAQ